VLLLLQLLYMMLPETVSCMITPGPTFDAYHAAMLPALATDARSSKDKIDGKTSDRAMIKAVRRYRNQDP